MSTCVAVLISDVHYNVNTLPLADAAMRMAINKANELDVPLIVAGDLHDTKANLRGECVKAMINTFRLCKQRPYVLIGNHDLINEKSLDNSLEFLIGYAHLINAPAFHKGIQAYLIPYHSDPQELQDYLATLPSGSLIICHQGVHSANLGHYVQDKTALPKEAFSNYRVISGHYHTRQDIKCGRPQRGAVGLYSYIGNPYTLTFGEANDPEKGFQILMDDGLLEFVPTDLRKHVVIETDIEGLGIYADTGSSPNPGDLLWLKVKGPQSELKKLSKQEIGKRLLGHSNYKLDLIPTDSTAIEEKADALKDTEILDMLIESMGETKEQTEYLKKLWREIL